MSLSILKCFFRKLSSMAPHNNNASSTSRTKVILDQSSPYFVHPSDGPSSVTVSPVLDGFNYHSRARSMPRALGGKMMFEFVDGTIHPVIDTFDLIFRAWNRCNMLVHS